MLDTIALLVIITGIPAIVVVHRMNKRLDRMIKEI